MDDLRLKCPCGHDPDRHDDGGCRGGEDGYCDCRRQRWLAVEAAIVTPPPGVLALVPG